MEILIASYLAGILTVLAPCILPLLPVIIGGSMLESTKADRWSRVIVIIGSLMISVVLFTFLLKVSTSLLGVPQYVWNILSGFIVIMLGVSIVFPSIWEKVSVKLALQSRAYKLMQKSSSSDSGIKRNIILGASLGPVFTSCSPTYALIVAIILPESLFKGSIYLLTYAFGLASILLLVVIFGSKIVSKLGWLSNPSGLFKKIIGVLFVLVGLIVITGLDRDIQSFILEKGWYDPIKEIEDGLY